jgi:cytochrome c biogenesis protein CcdA
VDVEELLEELLDGVLLGVLGMPCAIAPLAIVIAASAKRFALIRMVSS